MYKQYVTTPYSESLRLPNTYEHAGHSQGTGFEELPLDCRVLTAEQRLGSVYLGGGWGRVFGFMVQDLGFGV